MKLSKDDVLKLARLSRLKLSDNEIAQFQGELSAILDYVNQLEAVDVSGLKPTYQVTGLNNVVRKDEVGEQVSKEQLLKNVPQVEGDHIKVKRMVG